MLWPSRGRRQQSNAANPRRCNATFNATLRFALRAGATYVLRAAVETASDGSATARAEALAAEPSVAATAARRNAEVWGDWWATGARVHLPTRSTLQDWFHGQQYLLRCVANGASTAMAGLAGPFAFTTESTGWWDSLTLNYNLEAILYHAATSNHIESLEPYFPAILSLLPLGRARARATWSAGGHESFGATAQRLEAMGCACVDYSACVVDRAGRTCPAGFGNFSGISLPANVGLTRPDLSHASHDAAQRSIGAIVAQPFVERVEFTKDDAFLRDVAYPYRRPRRISASTDCPRRRRSVAATRLRGRTPRLRRYLKEVADHYASYVVSRDGAYELPHACAQELCNQRTASAAPARADDGSPPRPSGSARPAAASPRPSGSPKPRRLVPTQAMIPQHSPTMDLACCGGVEI